MGEDAAGELLSQARELERRDVDVAVRLDAVTGLLERVDTVRGEAARVRDARAAIPAEIEHVEQAERHADARAAAARSELAEAERRLAEVGRSRRAGGDARAGAERAVRRASVAAADCAATVERMRERLQALGHDDIALRVESEGIGVEARDVARAVSEVPRLSDSGRATPGGSLEEIVEWGARAHAALFVVRGSLESERERVVFEANALAAAALGEQPAGSSVALVRRRLEESLQG